MKVKVLGKDYDIISKKDLVRDQDKYALVIFTRQTIEIDADLMGNQNQQLEESVLHEICHIVFHAIMGTKLMEDQITVASEIIYHVLKDNPHFFKVSIADSFAKENSFDKKENSKKRKMKSSKKGG